jgi:hypothetical protein
MTKLSGGVLDSESLERFNAFLNSSNDIQKSQPIDPMSHPEMQRKLKALEHAWCLKFRPDLAQIALDPNFPLKKA